MGSIVSPIARTALALAVSVSLAVAPLGCALDEGAVTEDEGATPPGVTLDHEGDGPAERAPADPEPDEADEVDPPTTDDPAMDRDLDGDLVETPQGAMFALHAVERGGEPPAQLWTDPGDEGLEPVLGEGEEYLQVEITLVEAGSGHLKPCDDDCALLLPAQAGDEPTFAHTSGIRLHRPDDLAHGGYELVDGAHMILVFEVRDDASPDAVRLFLEHFERWSPDGEPEGVEGLTVDVPLG